MERPFPAYKGDEPYVFVSYSHDNSSVVFPELIWLKERGFNVWYDEGIEAGTEWREEIARAIKNARLFLYFVTPESVQSENCRKEVNFAVDEQTPIIAIHLKNTDLPDGLKLTLSDRQAIIRHEIPASEYQQKLQSRISSYLDQPTIQPAVEVRKKTVPILASVAGVVVLAFGLFFYNQQTAQQARDATTANPTDASTVDQPVKTMTNQVDQAAKKSIAVLPLDNLSPDPDNAYFAAGVHEEILNQLAKISEIKVISRTTVKRYRDSDLSAGDIARELNVGTIMQGSVRFAGNRVRITTQLIRATDDIHLWSETYEFELDDIFAIQSDVAKQIAHAMQATLSPDEIANIERPATDSTEAYTLFLQHRYQQEQENVRLTLDEDGWLESGIRKMERAVSLDPLFARGFAELGFLKWNKALFGAFEERNDLYDWARFYANKAIEIDPTIARAYTVLQRLSFMRRQWDEWESYARKSVELPDSEGRAAHHFASTLAWLEQYEEAYHWSDVAISKDPSFAIYREMAVWARISGRDYETALTMAEQFRAVGGENNAYHVMRAYIFSLLDRQAESVNELSEISAEPMAGIVAATPGYHDYLRCQSGQQDRVMAEIEKQDSEYIREIRIRYCAAGAGDLDAIFESFQRIMSRGENFVYAQGAIFDEVRDDPRWQAVKEYMNYPVLN